MKARISSPGASSSSTVSSVDIESRIAQFMAWVSTLHVPEPDELFAVRSLSFTHNTKDYGPCREAVINRMQTYHNWRGTRHSYAANAKHTANRALDVPYSIVSSFFNIARWRCAQTCGTAGPWITLQAGQLFSIVALPSRIHPHSPRLSRAMNEAVRIAVHNARSSKSGKWRDGDACVVSYWVF